MRDFSITILFVIMSLVGLGFATFRIVEIVSNSPKEETPILKPISDAEYERWKHTPEPVIQLPENYSLTFVLPDGRKVELSPNDTENMLEKALREK